MKTAIRIENDLFGIVARLKSIDEGYFVVFNTQKQAFEVHNDRQRGSTFSLSVPYPCLDVRTVTLVQKTRVENAAKIFAETEKENAALFEKEKTRAVKEAEKRTERLLSQGESFGAKTGRRKEE